MSCALRVSMVSTPPWGIASRALDGQVQQNLIQLNRIGPDRRHLGAEFQDQLLGFGERPAQDRLQLLDHLVQVHGLRLKDLPAAECQKLPGNRGGALSRGSDVLGILAYLRAAHRRGGG